MREILFSLVAFGTIIILSEQGFDLSTYLFGKEGSHESAVSVASADSVQDVSQQGLGAKRIDPIAHPYKVVTYILGDRRIDETKIHVAPITHINYAFVDLVDGEVKSFLPYDRENLRALCRLRDSFPHLKILVSIGGWTRSKGFSDAALTDDSRDKFARSAINFMKKHHLDGIDVDWEYPGMIGAGNTYRKADKQNFTLMLKVLREHLDRESELDGRKNTRPYLLTIAGAAGEHFLKNTEMDKVHRSLDFINLMSYDFSGSWSRRTAHHTNLYPSHLAGGSRIDVAETVRKYVQAGVPANKLTMGLAFFGRGWDGVKPQSFGLHQLGGKESGSIAYHTLTRRYINKRGYQRYWDTLAKAPYLWNAESQSFITYDDTASLKHKAAFVSSQALAGVMIWEYYRDTSRVLLNTLHREFNLRHQQPISEVQFANHTE